MTRMLNIVMILAAGLAALFTFEVKENAALVSERLTSLSDAISKEEETISLLKAEISFLMQPARIEGVVARNPDVFALAVLEPERIVPLSAIPIRASVLDGKDEPLPAPPTSIEDILLEEAEGR